MNGTTDFEFSHKMHNIMPSQLVCFDLFFFFFLAVFDYIRKVFFEKSRHIRISQWCNKPPVLSGIKYRTNIVMWGLVSCFFRFLGLSVNWVASVGYGDFASNQIKGANSVWVASFSHPDFLENSTNPFVSEQQHKFILYLSSLISIFQDILPEHWGGEGGFFQNCMQVT